MSAFARRDPANGVVMLRVSFGRWGISAGLRVCNCCICDKYGWGTVGNLGCDRADLKVEGLEFEVVWVNLFVCFLGGGGLPSLNLARLYPVSEKDSPNHSYLEVP